ncbi:MAG TPA: hypothetical protein VFA18_10270, partial [Gemmataceae bacterium]|nr:hypothetical protein [Gemmataceae bacterium]
MGLLGKILAILNVLAAAAFVYLAAADWSKRQQWAFAAVRFEEVIDGLPVDPAQADPNEGTVLVTRYKESTPQQLQGTGSAVATQEEEVNRVKEELKKEIQDTTQTSALEQFTTEIQAVPNKFNQRVRLASIVLPLAKTDAERINWAGQVFDPAVSVTGKGSVLAKVIHTDLAAQKARLAQALLPLALTGDQREALALQIAKADKIDDLLGAEGPVEVTFKKALKQEYPGVNEKDNYAGKRTAIAHLLVNLGRSDSALPNWYKRVVAVVGYKAFADAANAQADAFRGMAARVRLATQGDLNNFLTRHQAVLEVLRTLNDQIKQRNAELAQHQEQEARYAGLVKDRAAERDKYQKTLEQARADLKVALQKQKDEEQALGM